MGFVDPMLLEENNYSNAIGDRSGCYLKHPFNPTKREACEKAFNSSKTDSRQVDLLTAQAVLNKSLQAPEKQMGAGAIVGIIVASILSITLMVVVIKKIKK